MRKSALGRQQTRRFGLRRLCRTFDLCITNGWMGGKRNGGLAPAGAVPEAAFEVVSSVLQASILCDRHEDDNCGNQKMPSSSSAMVIRGVHGISPHLISRFILCLRQIAGNRGYRQHSLPASISDGFPVPR